METFNRNYKYSRLMCENECKPLRDSIYRISSEYFVIDTYESLRLVGYSESEAMKLIELIIKAENVFSKIRND